MPGRLMKVVNEALYLIEAMQNNLTNLLILVVVSALVVDWNAVDNGQ
jgi:hypothetical protein